MIICAVIASLLCVAVTGRSQDPMVAQCGWPYVWGLARPDKTNPPAILWDRLLPRSTKPVLLFADVGVGILIGTVVGGLIGLAILSHRRFHTNKLLWLFISLVLLLPGWFVQDSMPRQWLRELFTDPSPKLLLLVVSSYTLLYGVPAVSLGWVLQGVVVILTRRTKERGHNAA